MAHLRLRPSGLSSQILFLVTGMYIWLTLLIINSSMAFAPSLNLHLSNASETCFTRFWSFDTSQISDMDINSLASAHFRSCNRWSNQSNVLFCLKYTCM